jgi:hypothetical protein
MGRSIRIALAVAVLAAAGAVWRALRADNELVKRTDLQREAFAAGQEAERQRRAAQEATAHMWTPAPMPDWLVATAKEAGAKYPRLLPGGTVEWRQAAEEAGHSVDELGDETWWNG